MGSGSHAGFLGLSLQDRLHRRAQDKKKNELGESAEGTVYCRQREQHVQRLGGREAKHYERSEDNFVWLREINNLLIVIQSQSKESDFMPITYLY